MALLNTYASLNDVRRILRSPPPTGRIRFSESYNILRRREDNTGTVELTGIHISEEYANVSSYKFVFQSDSSSFTMYKVDTDKATNLIVGQGIKQTDFSSNDGYLFVDATAWIGYVFPGDVIEFQTDSHVSNNDGTRFIQDAEFFVDSILEKNIRFLSTSETSLRFDSTSVPKSVQLASIKIGAYFIYKSQYLEQNISIDQKNDFSKVWLREGLELLSSYVDKNNLALSTSASIFGHAGSNQPADLNNDFVFKSNQFNLRIPIQALLLENGYFYEDQKAFNFVHSSNYLDSLVSDIAGLHDGFGFY